MFEGYTKADQRAQLESAAETSWIKKYVRATIAEADPQGHIRTHEGVVRGCVQSPGKAVEGGLSRLNGLVRGSAKKSVR
jgi:hypothetical protein